MNKNTTLTVEELKALQEGDWVWLPEKNAYGQVLQKDDTGLTFAIIVGYTCTHIYRSYKDYSISWVAYRNKEESNSKGEQ